MEYEAIVVGAGYFGCSAAYHLAKAGIKTLLVESGTVGSGASGANFGNVQVQDANLGPSLHLTLDGIRKMQGMEAELERPIGYRPQKSLIGAEHEGHLPELESLYRGKKEAGLNIRWLEGPALWETEPNLSPGSIVAATYYEQGIVYPFHYLYALVDCGRELGLTVLENTPVERLYMEGGACRGIVLKNSRLLRCEQVVMAAGAKTHELCKTAGLDVPVHAVKAEGLATEPLKPFMNTYYSSAAFFAEAHSQNEAATSLSIGQSHYGNMLIAETTKPPHWVDEARMDCTSSEHCRNIREKLLAFFPALQDIQIMRSWVTLSPYKDNCEPVLGRCSVPGLILASGFKSAVVMSGVAGEIVAGLVKNESCPYDLRPYALP